MSENKQAEIEGGATLWARQTIESEIFMFKPHVWFKIWFYLVNRASHKDAKNYERGEAFFQTEWICKATGATTDQVKKCFSWLREMEMIRTRRSTRGVFVFIPQYSRFQTLDNYYYKVKAPTEAPEKHQRSTTVNKNDKNDKNTSETSSQGVENVIEEEVTYVTYVSDDSDPLEKTKRKITPEAQQVFGAFSKSKKGWMMHAAQRESADRLYHDRGLDEVRKALSFYSDHKGEKYCPIINTPFDLEAKWSSLHAFGKRKSEEL